MFLGFLLFLRSGGIKVSLHDWLALTEGLHQGLHGQSFHGFYILCRTLLVKTESDLDKFDGMFYQYFKTVDSAKISQELKELSEDPETAAKTFAGYFQKNEMELSQAMAIMEERLTAEEGEFDPAQPAMSGEAIFGNAPGGAGAGPGTGNGAMMQGAGGKSIIHARGDRRFRDWRTDCTIESRQFQMAFRLLRELSRKLETSEEELDIRGTIDHTCKRGGILDIRMQPPRKNRLKLMVLIDSGGSMRPYEQLCSLLFQSLNKANTFSDLKIYYFHNCLEQRVYEDPEVDPEKSVKSDWVLKNISSEYKVIFVGDADMAIHELMDSSQSSWSAASADGITWFKRFKDKYPHSIWLHPQEREQELAWMPESFVEIEKVFPMFQLSIDGLKDGMYKLMRGN